MVVDGNRQEDAYMLDIFHEVLGGTEQAGFFVWRSNFHEAGEGETEASLQEGMERVRTVVWASTFSCIMQKWGGKREVMYTAFKALGDSVDYIQVRCLPRHVCTWGHIQPAGHIPAGALGLGSVLCTPLFCTEKGNKARWSEAVLGSNSPSRAW
jgi:hypothetical protein